MNVGVDRTGIDLKSMSNDELRVWGENLIEDKVTLVRNQDLSEEDLERIFKAIGRTLTPNQFFMHPDYPSLFRVTNRRDDKGEKIGIFADKELDWHSNGNGRPSGRECCVALYCVEPGVDSVTSFCDTQKAYEELPTDIKQIVDDIDCTFMFKNKTFYDLDETDKELIMFETKEIFPEGVTKPLVYSHPFSGEKGLYFTFHYITKMWRRNGEPLDQEWLMQFLKDWVFQEKYIYHHNDWRKGDLIFMDQFHTIHKRNEVKGDRLLYRTTLDYSKSLRRLLIK